ncbi:MAG: hypothetical protein OXF55_00805 [Caldilineaceae bacterium]|nr:hypothetical protein [Caldilineaceae bacterium]
MTIGAGRQGDAPALKGSWEGLHAEAVALSRQGNDEAIDKLGYLIERLTGLPEARRMAQEARLQTILEQSVLGLQSHFARRHRLEEMAAASEEILEILSEDARSLWRENQARAHWWQGRHESAVGILRAEVDKLPFEVELRWLLFSVLVDAGDIDEADRVKFSLLDKLAGLFQEKGLADMDLADEHTQLSLKEQLAGGESDDQVSLQFGLLHFLNASVEIERGNWQEALDAFGSAAKLSDAYRERWHLIYRPLVVNRQARLAQRALNREKSPASQGFWRGLSGFYAGDRQGAAAEWRRVTQISLDEVTVPSVGDWILAHYYLDAPQLPGQAVEDVEDLQTEASPVNGGDQGALTDTGRKGLQVALNLLGQRDTRRDPLVLGLAALGWGMAGNNEHLHRNLRHSVELLRGSLQDNKLAVFNWYFFHDLLSPEDFAGVEQFFHVPKADNRTEFPKQ